MRPKAAFEFYSEYTMRGLTFFWRLRDGAGYVLAISHGYGTRSSALRAAKRLRDIVQKAVIT